MPSGRWSGTLSFFCFFGQSVFSVANRKTVFTTQIVIFFFFFGEDVCRQKICGKDSRGFLYRNRVCETTLGCAQTGTFVHKEKKGGR